MQNTLAEIVVNPACLALSEGKPFFHRYLRRRPPRWFRL